MSTWIFGYGSLIWNPGFDFEEKQQASFDGWERRFWQGSEDHRGVPGAPGRVLTLVPGSSCQGIAYRLHNDHQTQILNTLDHREKGGYERIIAPLQLPDGSTVKGITYVASTSNPLYLGEATTQEIARQIASSTGPSGTNREYLLELASAFRSHGIQDDHVFALERELLGFLQS